MTIDSKLLAAPAFALALALAACGNPAEEADQPLQTAPDERAMTDAPAAPVAAGPDETAAEVDEAAAPAPGATGTATPAPSPAATPTAASTTPAPTLAAAASPPPIWAVCSACHAVTPGDHGIGPSLAGIYNAPAASKPGFNFSNALESSGLTWSETNLDRYLADPRGTVPGTSMAYNGLRNDAQRQAVVDYLKGL